MEKAVLQLTNIVGALSKDRAKTDIEALLDGVEPENAETASSSSGKGKSAVYQKLRRALQDNPSFIYTSLEAQLKKDFNVMRSAPGSSSQTVSSRAWLEHRSRLGYHPMSIQYGWILCGIWDALRAGAIKEARARVAVALAACDQRRQELLLEDPPPMQSFHGRKSPDPWEQGGAKLVDERLLDVMMWKVKTRDSYLESRKRLSGGKGRPDNPPKTEAKNAKDKDKEKKGAKGAKGAKKGSSEGDPPAL